jgi:hypothetical protein
MVRPLRSMSRRRIVLLAAAAIIAFAVLATGFRFITAVHPQVTRQQAIASVLGSKTTSGTHPRAEAKYMRRSDAETVLGSHIPTPDIYVWVVAISGSGPAGEPPGLPKSALLVLEDRPGLRRIMSQSSTVETWPSIFDRLPDRSNGL